MPVRRDRLIRPTKPQEFNILQEGVGLISVAHQAVLRLPAILGTFSDPIYFSLFRLIIAR